MSGRRQRLVKEGFRPMNEEERRVFLTTYSRVVSKADADKLVPKDYLVRILRTMFNHAEAGRPKVGLGVYTMAEIVNIKNARVLGPGITKLNPNDSDNPEIAEKIAISRAVRSYHIEL